MHTQKLFFQVQHNSDYTSSSVGRSLECLVNATPSSSWWRSSMDSPTLAKFRLMFIWTDDSQTLDNESTRTCMDGWMVKAAFDGKLRFSTRLRSMQNCRVVVSGRYTRMVPTHTLVMHKGDDLNWEGNVLPVFFLRRFVGEKYSRVKCYWVLGISVESRGVFCEENVDLWYRRPLPWIVNGVEPGEVDRPLLELRHCSSSYPETKIGNMESGQQAKHAECGCSLFVCNFCFIVMIIITKSK